MYVYRIQKGNIRDYRGMDTLLNKNIQETRINGLPDKKILLMCYEQNHQR